MPYAPVRATSVALREAAPDIRSAGGELDSPSFGSRKFWLVATVILVPFIYFLLIGRYGWSDQDDGWMLGAAWRVYNGQLPYRDFLYGKPPVSPILHSIWCFLFSSKFLFAGSRLVAISETWIISLIGSFILCKDLFADSATLQKSWFGLAIGSFLFSVCGVTPMLWYTTDGILFALIGVYLVIYRRDLLSMATASLAILLSAGTKQSFYPFICFCILYLLLCKRWKDAAALFLSFSAFGALGVVAMRHFGMLANFASMTSGSLRMHDALKAGIYEYLTTSWTFGRILLLITLPVWALCRFTKRRFRPEFLVACFFVGIVATYLRHWRTQLEFVSMARGGFSQLLFLVVVLYAIWRLYRRERVQQTLGFLLLLAISWCASISWGYLAPIMFSVPLLVGSYLVMARLAAGHKEHILRVGGVGIAVTVIVASLYPYEDMDGRLHDHSELGSIDPHLAFIVSGEKSAEKLTEFITILREFRGRYVTFPAFEMSYILGNTLNPIDADWATNIEVGPRQPVLQAELDEKTNYGIVDKAPTKPSSDPIGVPLIDYVSEHWKLAYDGVWYRVYENPHLSADVPHASKAPMEKN